MTMNWTGAMLGRRFGGATSTRELALGRLERVRQQQPARPSAPRWPNAVSEAAPPVEHSWNKATGARPRLSRRLVVASLAGVVAVVVVAIAVIRMHGTSGPAHSTPQPAVERLDEVIATPAAEVLGPPAPAMTSDEAVQRVRTALSTGDEQPKNAAPGPLSYVQSAKDQAPAARAVTNGWNQAGAPSAGTGQSSDAVASAPASNAWTRAGVPGDAQQPPPAPPATAASAKSPIIWPASGPITSYFGPSHPLGIDIGIPLGTPLRAVADGQIAFVGGDACCSYGYYVDIDHGNGVMTRYGHMLYIPALKVGQSVHQGDIIGLSGTTGYSTGPHLHFEIRLYGRVVDPLRVLPGGSSR